MAHCTALLLLAALALANVPTGIAKCGHWSRWQCGSGMCIVAEDRCDGVLDCSDGSDEEAAMCEKVPSIRVQVGQVTTVRAEYKEEYLAVEFHLCGVTSCSKLWLWGHNADGALGYIAYTECNARGGHCSSHHHSSVPDGFKDFPAGPLVFKAERRSGELAVWLDGHEDKAATVPVKEGSDLLRVKAWNWSSDLAVQFGPSCANGGTPSGDACICKPGFVGASCQQDINRPTEDPSSLSTESSTDAPRSATLDPAYTSTTTSPPPVVSTFSTPTSTSTQTSTITKTTSAPTRTSPSRSTVITTPQPAATITSPAGRSTSTPGASTPAWITSSTPAGTTPDPTPIWSTTGRPATPSSPTSSPGSPTPASRAGASS